MAKTAVQKQKEHKSMLKAPIFLQKETEIVNKYDLRAKQISKRKLASHAMKQTIAIKKRENCYRARTVTKYKTQVGTIVCQ